MAERNPAILARSEWLHALRDLALDCAGSDTYDAQHRVLQMNELLLVAPEQGALEGLQPIAPVRLRRLLDAGAADAAVLGMLDHGAGYMLSRSGDGQSLATVVLPGAIEEASAAGVTPALALVGALALALATVKAARPSMRTSELARIALH